MNEIKTGVTRVQLMGIPVDNVLEETLDELVRSLLNDSVHHQIVYISLKDFLRAKFSKNYRNCLKSASLVLPTSMSLVRGVKFLHKQPIERHMPFRFTIQLMGTLERQRQSLYLLGSKAKPLHKIALNTKDSFPGLRVVGRCAGYYSKEMESNVVMAVKKAAPSLLLCGPGLKGRDLWITKRKSEFNPGLSLWCGECFDIIAGRKKRISVKSWEKGTFHLRNLFLHPWRIYKIFHHFLFGMMLITAKIKQK